MQIQGLTSRTVGIGLMYLKPLCALVSSFASLYVTHEVASISIWSVEGLNRRRLHRRLVDRRLVDRRLVDRRLVDRRLVDRRLVDGRCG